VLAYRKKAVFLLVIVALGSCAPAMCRAETTVSKSSEKLFVGSDNLFTGEPNFSVGSEGRYDTREMFFRMMLSVLLVIVLGIALIYFLKRFSSRITGLSGKRIHIIETAPLGPRRMVHLVEVGNRRILIGSTNENITMLADVTEALRDVSDEQMED
jgi:flagellar biosynthetic protein FliO